MLIIHKFLAVYFATVKELGCECDGKVDLVKYPIHLGIATSLCSGSIHKKELSVKEIARESVLEKCGFDVSVDRLEEVMSYRQVHCKISQISGNVFQFVQVSGVVTFEKFFFKFKNVLSSPDVFGSCE